MSKLKRFHIGDKVRIKEGTDNMFPHYIEEFNGKVGDLFDITKSSNGSVAFHVSFKSNRIGIFYENELEHVTK